MLPNTLVQLLSVNIFTRKSNTRVNFEKKTEKLLRKDVIIRSVGQSKNMSPQQESTLRPSAQRLELQPVLHSSNRCKDAKKEFPMFAFRKIHENTLKSFRVFSPSSV